MDVVTYDHTTEELLNNLWSDTDNDFVFRLVSDSYSFSAAHTAIYDVSSFFVGSDVSVTGRGVSSTITATTLTCANIVVSEATAAGAVIYKDDKPYFYMEFADGDDYVFSTKEEIYITPLLTITFTTDALVVV
jgi:hypothetical protein